MINRTLALQLKQLKISKLINDYLKKYIDDRKVYRDIVRLRELTDEQDKLLDIE
jgi:hypothetical protein